MSAVVDILVGGVAITGVFTLGTVSVLALSARNYFEAKIRSEAVLERSRKRESIEQVRLMRAQADSQEAAARAANEVGRRIASDGGFGVGLPIMGDECPDPDCNCKKGDGQRG